MAYLFTNIKELIGIDEHHIAKKAGAEMKTLRTIKNAFLLVEDGVIEDYGAMDELSMSDFAHVTNVKSLDTTMVLPTWCDSHTHIVYAGNREQEFVDRINGLSYEEIANKGGGILNSAKKLQETDEETLYEQSAQRLEEVMKLGTGAVEIKSGYGLTTEAELKMLRVIKKLKENYPLDIKATLLGSHALPPEYKNNRKAYIDLLIDEMLPKIADEQLADYIDVFCETGYFTRSEERRVGKGGRS